MLLPVNDNGDHVRSTPEFKTAVARHMRGGMSREEAEHVALDELAVLWGAQVSAATHKFSKNGAA